MEKNDKNATIQSFPVQNGEVIARNLGDQENPNWIDLITNIKCPYGDKEINVSVANQYDEKYNLKGRSIDTKLGDYDYSERITYDKNGEETESSIFISKDGINVGAYRKNPSTENIFVHYEKGTPYNGLLSSKDHVYTEYLKAKTTALEKANGIEDTKDLTKVVEEAKKSL